jgi:hypothetical protein
VAGVYARDAIVVAGDRAFQRQGIPCTGMSKIAVAGGVPMAVVGRSAMHDELGRVCWSLLHILQSSAPERLGLDDVPALAARAAAAVRRRPPRSVVSTMDSKYESARVAFFFPEEVLTFKVDDDGASAVEQSPQHADMTASLPVLFGLVGPLAAQITPLLSPRSAALLRCQPRIGELAVRDALDLCRDVQHCAAVATRDTGAIGGGLDVLIYDRATGRITEGATS